MSDATAIPAPDVSEDHPISEHWIWMGTHRPPMPRAYFEMMTSNWAPQAMAADVHPGAAYTADRRQRLAAALPNTTLVIPTGLPKVRSNDTDYEFRPGSDFYYLTSCFDPEAALVIDAAGVATLYLAPRRDHHTAEYFSNARYGELWVGPRRGLEEAAHHFGIATASLDDLPKVLADVSGPVAVVRSFDAGIDALVPADETLDDQLVTTLHGMRLIKDDFELAQLQLAVDYTITAFGDVARALPHAVRRGERVIEGVFNLRARVEGNSVGYSTIAASGAHATILHWTRNDGEVREGDLLLLDAGVECANLYTADVTRTFPVNGTFSDAQRRIYELVLAAQEAAIAVIKPGISFRLPHETAMAVLAEGLYELGILREKPDEALQLHRQSYRRWTLHGVSHWLGIDVHDCAQARNEVYTEPLVAGQVLTVEPGLYFQANDLSVPEMYRGIGVRIEDDIVVTETGWRNLSAGLPRTVADIEAWIAAEQAKGIPALGL